MITVFTDGGARGNPGPAAIGVYITDDQHHVIHTASEKIGIATNNVAEYKAVIKALSWFLDNKKIAIKNSSIRFFLDSQLVVSQVNGLFKVKNANLRSLLFEIREKEAGISAKITYSHIAREKNTKADALVNKALDNT
ncbi:MAG: ribonuclease HI family protein [Candidatus Levybacteria bacterium]|nr:ribonuclease HI family protein [Candidatus Levybacteria bacterium]